MKLSLKNEVPAYRIPVGRRRCRPLLGTFVEVSVGSDDQGEVNAAIDAAFAAIERVHQLMSFYDAASEVSKLNRLAVSRSVTVSDETYEVLNRAQELHKCSGGIFDITVASELIRKGLLPNYVGLNRQKDNCGTTMDIELLPKGRVRFLQPLCIDLGGIAKGFAVDEGIKALRSQGVDNGFINAGGDMRGFGDHAWPICVRHPQNSGQLLPLLALKNAAFATSANS